MKKSYPLLSYIWSRKICNIQGKTKWEIWQVSLNILSFVTYMNMECTITQANYITNSISRNNSHQLITSPALTSSDDGNNVDDSLTSFFSIFSFETPTLLDTCCLFVRGSFEHGAAGFSSEIILGTPP